MQTGKPSLFTRPDTFFGVCQGLGEDFSFHPNLLRLALAGVMFWNPYVALGVYTALGLLVLVSRLLAPNPVAAIGGPTNVAALVSCRDALESQADPLPLAA